MYSSKVMYTVDSMQCFSLFCKGKYIRDDSLEHRIVGMSVCEGKHNCKLTKDMKDIRVK